MSIHSENSDRAIKLDLHMAGRMGLRGSRVPIGVSALLVIVLLALHALVLPAASRPLHEAESTVQPEKVTVEASEVSRHVCTAVAVIQVVG
jgi:hypothetical protein